MIVTNRLTESDIGDVLEWLQAARKTGALEVDNGEVRKLAYFIDGSVVGIDSNDSCDAIGYRLCKRGLLSAEQLVAAEALVGRTGHALVDVLHITGVVSEAELESLAREQVMEALWSAFLWDDGSFVFREDVLPEELAAAVSLEVSEFLAEGLRRRERARELRREMPAKDAAYLWTGGPFPDRDPTGERLLGYLGEPRTLRSLQTLLPATEWEVLQRVAAMLKRNEVFVASGGVAEAAGTTTTTRTAAAVSGSETVAVSSAVGVLEREPIAANGVALLEQARHAMDERRYAAALELFRRAEAASPGDARMSMLRQSAEQVCAAGLQRSPR